MSSPALNNNLHASVGTHAQRPTTSLGFAAGHAWVETDTGQVYFAAKVAGAYVWVQTAGGGANGIWPKYVVSKATGPNATYQTISAAITAAFVDGHTGAAPAAILVMPGTYVENVTLLDGMWLMGLSEPAQQDLNFSGTSATSETLPVVITGSVSLDAGFKVGGIANLQIAPPATVVPFQIGANSFAFSFRAFGCIFSATGAATPVVTGAPTGAPSLSFDHCKLVNTTTQAGVGGLSLTTAIAELDFLDSSIQCNVGTDAAMLFGAVVTLLRCKNTAFLGEIEFVAGASSAFFEKCSLTVSGATQYIAVTAGAPTVVWVDGSMIGSGATPNLTGTFTFTRRGILGSDANGLQPATTVTMNILRGLADAYTSRDNGAGNLIAANVFLADVHTLDTTAAGRGVALPAANLFPPGVAVTFCAHQSGAGAFAITVTPNGADTINGLNNPVVTAANVKGCASVMRDPNATTNWILLSIQ
jgi:hypothetical protein